MSPDPELLRAARLGDYAVLAIAIAVIAATAFGWLR